MHDLRCYGHLIMAAFRANLQHRVNFAFQIVGLFINYSAQYLNIWWLTRRYPHLQGWAVEELLLLLAMAILAWGFCVTFFWRLVDFGEKVRSGDFDRVLVRPLSPFLQILAEQSPIAATGQLIWSIGAFAWASAAAGVHWTPGRLAYLLAVTVGGGLILGAACTAVAAAAFWVVRSQGIYWTIVYPARQLIMYPVSIYDRPLQVALTFIVPFAFINYFPASYLLNKADVLFHPLLPLLAPLVGVVAFAAAYRLWWLGVSRYQGTGS